MDVLQEAEKGVVVVVVVDAAPVAVAAEVEVVWVGIQMAEAEPSAVVFRRRAFQGRFGVGGRRFGHHPRILLPLLWMPLLIEKAFR